ncbi:uncharacterized protein LOC126980936 [Eriocheir sinensis]|uniref:uncharacterized protein LOC126980936 n=1 Tax=Eriocheir sinensis TaxID=95602 RepID=UPI0021C93F2D|nr:uncharacterized protein LOC126980936 [Eriocheir sinensis]
MGLRALQTARRGTGELVLARTRRVKRAASPPSGGANKNRRPNSLGVTSTPPSKPSSGRPSPARSPVPKKTGGVNKASTPPGKSVTCAQGPVLATEARSKVRPCGCSRRHGAGHHHPPETPKEPIRRKPKTEPPVKASSPLPAKPPKQTCLAPLMALPEKTGSNRYVTTLTWVPKQTSSAYSTTVIVSNRDPAFSEVICIKQRGRCPDNLAEARKH